MPWRGCWRWRTFRQPRSNEQPVQRSNGGGTPLEHQMSQEGTIEEAVTRILQSIGEDPQRQGLKETPKRVAKLYAELFSGLHKDPAAELSVTYEGDYRDIVLVRDIRFYSMCEHDLLPFFGSAHIGYVPNGRVVGISKLARALEVLARRPQIQERLTEQLADAVYRALGAQGVVVMMEAEHLCMSMRGVQRPGTRVVTSATRGDIDRDHLLTLVQNSRA